MPIHNTRVKKTWISGRGKKNQIVSDDEIAEQIRNEISAIEGVDSDSVTIYGIRREETGRKSTYWRIENSRLAREPGDIVVDYGLES